MGVVTRLLRQPERREAMGAGSTAWLQEALLGPSSASGVSVSPEGSLRYTAVLACARVLAEGVASLPCILYERFDVGGQDAKRRARSHQVYRLLHDAPNPVMTALEFFEVGMAHALLWGNFYAEIEWSPRGQVLGLWPLPAWRVTPGWSRQGKSYRLQIDGQADTVLSDYQVLHVPGFGYDGVSGRSMISLAREAIGLGLAAERYGGSVFGNGVVPGGVLEHPGQLSDEAYRRLQESWSGRHQGLANAQRLAILEEGMKYDKVGIPPEDAQFLETRRFQRSEIAGIFRVPLHMIGDLERATFSNIEQQSTEFLTNSLAPWLRRWEQRVARSLLVGRERERFYAEFLVDALLRGDTATRYAAYATGRQWGWLSVNDIRARENMNPVDGGDEYLVPLNMVEAGGEPSTNGATNARMVGRADGEDVRAQTLARSAHSGRPPGCCAKTGQSSGHGLGGDAATGLTPGGAGDGAGRGEAEHRAAGKGRRRLASAHQAALEDAAQRVLNRETNDILNAARRLLGTSPAEFSAWLTRFLEEDRGKVENQLWPSMWALGLVAGDAAHGEGAASGFDGRMTDATLEEFMRGVVAGRSTGWVEKLRIGIEERLAQEDEDPVAALETDLQQRREDEAEPWARDTSTGVVNAAAWAVWAAIGVTLLRWTASGAETCPYCEAMDGRVVDVQEFFVPLGGEVAPDGQPPLRPHRSLRHPPLHSGCDCMVTIG